MGKSVLLGQSDTAFYNYKAYSEGGKRKNKLMIMQKGRRKRRDVSDALE